MIEPSNYQNITIRLQEAQENWLVFYFVWNHQSEQNLLNRLTKKKNITLVLNKAIHSKELLQLIKKNRIELIQLVEKQWFQEKIRLANHYYPLAKKNKFIGITGTNGKTTTCFLGMLMSKNWGRKALYIGTLGIYLNGQWLSSNNGFTTPDPIDLRKILSRYQGEYDVVWIEASSHGLEQNRLAGIEFAATGWTSFSQDHLDYHKTMEEYLQSKEKIWDFRAPIQLLAEPIVGQNQNLAEAPDFLSSSNFLKINHNQKNFRLAYSIMEKIFGKPKNNYFIDYFVPGRFEIIDKVGKTFVVDFAHTPDSVDKLLEQCRQLWPSQSILIIIGCGGDRDVSKRSLMARIACENAKEVIFTEDNSRSEDLDKIFKDMTQSLYLLKTKNWLIIPDRREAIKMSIQKKIDIIVVAGKGSEEVIDRGCEKIQHCDSSFIRGLND